MDEAWLRRWVDDLRSAVERHVAGFEDTYGYPADDHSVGPPASEADLVALAAVGAPPDLVTLHRYVGPVDLPDVANGYWLSPASHVVREATSARGLQRMEGSAEPVLVVGSDGGGCLYVLPAGPSGRSGPVRRLTEVAVTDGLGQGGRVDIVADDLRHLLERLLGAVTTFADIGAVVDL